MIKQEEKQCECTKCGTKGHIRIYHLLQEPEKQGVENMSIFRWTCPKCGHVYKLIYPCVFYYPQGEFVIQCLGDEKSLDFSLDYTGCICRNVSSLEEMAEKVRVLSSGLDDRAMELLKLLIFAKVHVEDETMESIQFFQIGEDNSLEFTIFTGKGPDGIAVPMEMYHNVCKLANDLDYKEEGFLTIDLNWAGSQITN